MPEPESSPEQSYKPSWNDAPIAGNLVIAIVLNRYSSVMPFWCIVVLVLFGLAMGIGFIWNRISKTSMGKDIKYFGLTAVVIVVLMVWIVIQGIISLESKLHSDSTQVAAHKTDGIPPSPRPIMTQPKTKSVSAQPVNHVEHVVRPKTDAPNPVRIQVENNSGNIAAINNGIQTVNQSFGVPEPSPGIKWEQSPIAAGGGNGFAIELQIPGDEHPGVQVNFYTLRDFREAAIEIQCSAPCSFLMGAVPGSSRLASFPTRDPNVILVKNFPTLFAGETVALDIRSNDSRPIKVISLVGWIPPGKKVDK